MKIREEQLQRPQKRSGKAPRRHSQENSIFNPPMPIIPAPPEPAAVIPPPLPEPAQDMVIDEVQPSIERTEFKPVEVDFRCFNKFVVRKRVKSTAHRGRPRKKPRAPNVVDFQKLAQTPHLGEDAASAALEFARLLKDAA